MTSTDTEATATTTRDAAQPDRDLFRYGWRYIHHPLPNGGKTLEAELRRLRRDG
jgi:hypothetical protein